MLSLTPPTRVRGKMHSSDPSSLKSEYSSTALVSNGLYTPPHSIKEGRKSSVDDELVMADDSFASSPTSASLSQPPTPLQGFKQQGSTTAGSWPGCSGSELNTMLDPELMCSPTHAHPHRASYSSRPFSSGQMNEVASPIHRTTSEHFHPFEQHPIHGYPMQHPMWPVHPHDTMGFVEHGHSMEGGMHMARDVNFPTQHLRPIIGNPPIVRSNSIHGFGHIDHPFAHNPPQVVVPSQLAPHEDFSPTSLGEPLNVDNVDCFPNFPVGSGLDEFEVDPSSPPQDPYFITHEGGEWIPPHGEGSHNVEQRETSPSAYSDATYAPRRIGRRPRKAQVPGKTECFSRYTSLYGTDCRLQGKKFHFEGNMFNGQYTWVPEETLSPSKAHRCPHFDEHGKRCPVSFDRSEHLKRHVDSKHSNERKFPCPLPSCIDKKGRERRIGRSDNASDHFKTHLRPKPKGRRNKEYDWPTVKRYILDAYDPKRAGKLIEGLQRWVDAGMPEGGGTKR